MLVERDPLEVMRGSVPIPGYTLIGKDFRSRPRRLRNAILLVAV